MAGMAQERQACKTSTYKEINNLTYNHILYENISVLSSIFGIENLSIKNNWLPNILLAAQNA